MSRRWIRRVLGVLVLAVAALSLTLASRSAPPTAAERAHSLDAELRCPVCQGLSVADSPSSTAKAMADDVSRRVDAGQSDEQIRQYYVGRYGPGILLAPSGTPGVLADGLPLLFAALAAAGLFLVLLRGRRRSGRCPDAQDEAIVARLRAHAPGPADKERAS